MRDGDGVFPGVRRARGAGGDVRAGNGELVSRRRGDVRARGDDAGDGDHARFERFPRGVRAAVEDWDGRRAAVHGDADAGVFGRENVSGESIARGGVDFGRVLSGRDGVERRDVSGRCERAAERGVDHGEHVHGDGDDADVDAASRGNDDPRRRRRIIRQHVQSRVASSRRWFGVEEVRAQVQRDARAVRADHCGSHGGADLRVHHRSHVDSDSRRGTDAHRRRRLAAYARVRFGILPVPLRWILE